MVFIKADYGTKKAMAIEWGHNIEKKALYLWDKSSKKVVEVSHTVSETLDGIGQTVVNGTTEVWNSVSEGAKEAWDIVSTSTIDIEENVRTKVGEWWRDRHRVLNVIKSAKDLLLKLNTEHARISLSETQTKAEKSHSLDEDNFKNSAYVIFSVVALVAIGAMVKAFQRRFCSNERTE